MTISAITANVLASLWTNVEGRSSVIDGHVWRDVNLDNARPDGMSAHAFAGHLSVLEQVGWYQSEGHDGWGHVKTAG